MTVVAAIVHIVGAIKPRKKLQQKSSFVAAATAKVPERFCRRNRLELGCNAIESFGPSDRSIRLGTLFVKNRLDQTTARFHLSRRVMLHLTDRVLRPEVRSDCRLHISRHRLNRLLTDFGE